MLEIGLDPILDASVRPSLMLSMCNILNFTFTPDVGCWDPLISGHTQPEVLWSPTEKREHYVWIPLEISDSKMLVSRP